MPRVPPASHPPHSPLHPSLLSQRHGSAVNIVAYWVVAVPAALLAGFYFKQGVQGLYSGMVLGPMIQTGAYLAIIMRLSWADEARLARQRAVDAGAV